MTFRNVFAVALIVSGLGLMLTEGRQARALSKPLGSVYARKVSATATATSLATLVNDSTLSGACAVSIANPSSTQLNVGGRDVDNSTKFFPVCNSSSCAQQVLPIDTNWSGVFVRTTSGSLDIYLLFGGGC
jgi:hypothetical protein